MSTSHYTTDIAKTNKRAGQKVQASLVVLPSQSRTFVSDLKAANKNVRLDIYANIIYKNVLGHTTASLLRVYGLPYDDVDAWEKIRPLLAQRSPIGFQYVQLCEELIRLRVVNMSLYELEEINREVMTVSLAVGTQAHDCAAHAKVELATGDCTMYSFEDELVDTDSDDDE